MTDQQQVNRDGMRHARRALRSTTDRSIPPPPDPYWRNYFAGLLDDEEELH